MKGTIMKTHLLIGLLALSLFHSASALTINPLVQSSLEQPIFGNPVLLNERVFYMQKMSDGGEAVMVYNMSNNAIERSFSGDFLQDNQLQSLFVIADYVYMVVYDEDEAVTEVWRTQGDSFSRVSTPVTIDRFADLAFDNGTLFITAADNTVITLDGEHIIQQQYAQAVNFSQDRCAFDASNYLIALRGTEGRFVEMVRYLDGAVSEISTDYPDGFFPEITQVGNTCLLAIRANGVYSSLVEINESGGLRTLDESLDLSGFSQLFTFKNNWYVLGSFDNGLTSSLARLNIAQSTLDAQFDVDPINQFYSVSTTRDYILALSTTPTASPPVNITWYLDENLVLNEELTNNNGAPDSFPILGGELLVTAEYRGSRYDHTFAFALDPAPGTTLTLTRHSLRGVISHPDYDRVLLFLEHVATRRPGLYELAEQPTAGFNLAGIWHDPEIASQGMVVTTGERQDGSEYQFITFYTYEDGQPLWLAGLNEMSLGQSLVVTDLYRYQGGQMFSGDASPQQEVFGSLSLELLACNQVEVIFSHVQQADRLFTLERIENYDQDQPCVDLNQ